MNDLLAKITGLFTKEYLFRSFIPAFLFVAAILTTGVWALGFDAVLGIAASLSPLQVIAASSVLAIMTVAFGYVIPSFTSCFYWFWTGNAEWPIIRWLFKTSIKLFGPREFEKPQGEIEGEEDKLKREEHAIELRRSFSIDPHKLRGTKLGNIVESYSEYPKTRYGLEPDVCWPRLRFVMQPKHFKLMEAQWMQMDFLISIAGLALIYGTLALLVGPWLGLVWWSWLILGLLAYLVGWGFYRLSITAALNFGAAYKSCVDLYRLKLLRALRIQRPEKHSDEKLLWKELNKLITRAEEPVGLVYEQGAAANQGGGSNKKPANQTKEESAQSLSGSGSGQSKPSKKASTNEEE